MNLQNDQELATTKAKLAELEQLIAKRKADPKPTPARHMTMQSLSRLANQLREEIVRYECGGGLAYERERTTKLRDDFELANTKAKLADLERHIRERKADPTPSPGREMSLLSLARLANQLREEIIRYECGVKSHR